MRAMGLFCLFLIAFAAFAGNPGGDVVRGKLTQREGLPPAIQTRDGKLIPLQGDPDTLGVLNDKRLKDADVEVKGRPDGNRFLVDPIHTNGMHVHKDGKRLIITYWCDLCAIRTFTPGICWCCQEETELDLRDKL